MSWTATAPSNIALIKYMGKAGPSALLPQRRGFEHLSKKDKADLRFKNLSINPSLSYTLNHFATKALIEESDRDQWAPFAKDPFSGEKLYSASKKTHFKTALSAPAQKKFLDFFQFLKRALLISGNYTVRSQNNFPMSAGAASSASSFAALTLATFKLAKDRSSGGENLKNISAKTLAGLSRVGSGSSCRSFFSPWALWTDEGAGSFQTACPRLLHQLLVVDSQAKPASSTQAHILAETSPRFKGRAERAKTRLQALAKALRRPDWRQCFEICYEEFLDMHSLFETARPPIKYKNSDSQKALNCVNDYWQKNKDGPLATMDAGANIHLLYRPDQEEQREEITSLLKDYIVLSSASLNIK